MGIEKKSTASKVVHPRTSCHSWEHITLGGEVERRWFRREFGVAAMKGPARARGSCLSWSLGLGMNIKIKSPFKFW